METINNLAFYALQIICVSGILFSYYYFLLRNNRFHKYNRYYLLSIVLLSLATPLVQIQVFFQSKDQKVSAAYISLQALSDFKLQAANTGIQVSQSQWIWTLYALMVLFFVVKICSGLRKIFMLKSKNEVETINNIMFINTQDPATPFSFFKWLFWNKNVDLLSNRGQVIFRHEMYHIQNRHSSDILFLEIISTLFWFNPFFHLIKKEAKAIHEFLADEYALQKEDKTTYAEILLQQLLHTHTSLVNPFFNNQIKRRIAMILFLKKAEINTCEKSPYCQLSLYL